MRPIQYSHIRKISDVAHINNMIRREVSKTKTRAKLTHLYRQSKYLYTLTFSDRMKVHLTRLGVSVRSVREKARSEFHKTAVAINARSVRIGQKPDYDVRIG